MDSNAGILDGSFAEKIGSNSSDRSSDSHSYY